VCEMPLFGSRSSRSSASPSASSSTALLSSSAIYVDASSASASQLEAGSSETFGERVLEDAVQVTKYSFVFLVSLACVGVVLLLILGVLVAFLVQTPSFSVIEFRIGDPLNCTSAQPNCVPLFLTVNVNNPNIIGADFAGNFTLNEAANDSYIGFASFVRTSISARSTSELPVYVELEDNLATQALFLQVVVQDDSFPILVSGEVDVSYGLLNAHIPFSNRAFTILGITNYTNQTFGDSHQSVALDLAAAIITDTQPKQTHIDHTQGDEEQLF